MKGPLFPALSVFLAQQRQPRIARTRSLAAFSIFDFLFSVFAFFFSRHSPLATRHFFKGPTA